jgi:hypothetical protein
LGVVDRREILREAPPPRRYLEESPDVLPGARRPEHTVVSQHYPLDPLKPRPVGEEISECVRVPADIPSGWGAGDDNATSSFDRTVELVRGGARDEYHHAKALADESANKIKDGEGEPWRMGYDERSTGRGDPVERGPGSGGEAGRHLHTGPATY